MAKKIPTSILGRATKMVVGAGKIAGREIAASLADKFKDRPEFQKAQMRIKQAQDFVDSLSNLKGAAMKVGQLLSLEMSDLLPPDVVDVLRKLHDDATHLPLPDVEKILRSELGQERFAKLQSLSPTPIAAASIGQVHRATIDGAEVVLKIQYPGVAESIDTDIAMLKKLINGLLAMRGTSISFEAVFAELAEGLKRETDYLQEKEAIYKYESLFSKYPEYVIPKVFDEYCTRKVITLSYEEGERLNLWVKKDHAEQTKARFAKRILDLLFHELFTFGVVQTDPNYGNFLVRDNGEKIVLLDFGAVREYPPEFRTELKSILAAAIDGDRKRLAERSIAMGFLDPKEEDATKDLFYKLMELIASMFKEEKQPFNFADESYLNDIREKALEFAQTVQHTGPAHKILFLNRKLGGMYHLLKDLDCKIDLAKYWKALS